MDKRTQKEIEISFLEGEEAEDLVIDAINLAKNSTLKCESSKNSPFWTPYLDLVTGDIYLSYETSDGKKHVKRLDTKKNGWVTWRSAMAFGNSDEHYFVTWNGSVENSWVISAVTTKALMKKLEETSWIRKAPRSGQKSMNINDYDRSYEIKKKISLTKFIEDIDE